VTEAVAMGRGKHTLHARKQPRNSRGQFAPRCEVVYTDSDESGFSSAGGVPPLKRLKEGPSTQTPTNKVESSSRTQAKKNPNPSFNGMNKVNAVHVDRSIPFQLPYSFILPVLAQSGH